MSQEIKESVKSESFFQSFLIEEEEEELNLPDITLLFSWFFSTILHPLGHFFPTNPITSKIKSWERVQEDLPQDLVERMRHIKTTLDYNKPIIYMNAKDYDTIGGSLSFGPAVIAAPFKDIKNLADFEFEFSRQVQLIKDNNSRNYTLESILTLATACLAISNGPLAILIIVPSIAFIAYHYFTSSTYQADMATATVMGNEKAIKILKTKQKGLFEPSIEKRIDKLLQKPEVENAPTLDSIQNTPEVEKSASYQ